MDINEAIVRQAGIYSSFFDSAEVTLQRECDLEDFMVNVEPETSLLQRLRLRLAVMQNNY